MYRVLGSVHTSAAQLPAEVEHPVEPSHSETQHSLLPPTSHTVMPAVQVHVSQVPEPEQ